MLPLLLGCHPASGTMTAALTPAPDARLQVYAFQNGASPANIAHSFSSLDALVIGDELVVAGLQNAQRPGWWEERFPRLFVDALVTTDLVTWSSRRWYVDAPGASLLDPAFADGPEGLELWFVQAEGFADPARRGRQTSLVRTRAAGDGFGRAEVWHRGESLVDVSPVWFGDRWHVFATHNQSEVVEITATGTTRRIEGATVPHARVVDGGISVTAQTMVDGRRMPVVVRSTDGATWSAPAPVALDGTKRMKTCASPVTARLHAAEVLLCVDER